MVYYIIYAYKTCEIAENTNSLTIWTSHIYLYIYLFFYIYIIFIMRKGAPLNYHTSIISTVLHGLNGNCECCGSMM